MSETDSPPSVAGYFLAALRNKRNPPKDTKPSFAGQTIIITGANAGLGFEAAVKFVALGAAKVILGVRSLSKGENAAKQIESRTGRNAVTEVWHVDMLDYDSIKAFAARATQELEKLDVAVLNAGVVKMKHESSLYGYEQTMQVNVLSTTLLALLLLPKLRASKTISWTPVMEIVGSSNQYLVTSFPSEKTPFASCNDPAKFLGPQPAYNASKVFVMYAQTALVELARNKETGQPDVHIPVVCPGAVKSELARDATGILAILVWLVEVLIQRETEEGARTYISGVAEGEKTNGKFWRDDALRPKGPLVNGEKGKALQATVWQEVIQALERDVPEVKSLT